jgi:hypothetical protein
VSCMMATLSFLEMVLRKFSALWITWVFVMILQFAV